MVRMLEIYRNDFVITATVFFRKEFYKESESNKSTSTIIIVASVLSIILLDRSGDNKLIVAIISSS